MHLNSDKKEEEHDKFGCRLLAHSPRIHIVITLAKSYLNTYKKQRLNYTSPHRLNTLFPIAKIIIILKICHRMKAEQSLNCE